MPFLTTVAMFPASQCWPASASDTLPVYCMFHLRLTRLWVSDPGGSIGQPERIPEYHLPRWISWIFPKTEHQCKHLGERRTQVLSRCSLTHNARAHISYSIELRVKCCMGLCYSYGSCNRGIMWSTNLFLECAWWFAGFFRLTEREKNITSDNACGLLAFRQLNSSLRS